MISDGEASEGWPASRWFDGLFIFNSLGKGYIHDLVILYTDHHIALVIKQGIDCGRAHARSNNTVKGRGRSATLQMAQNSHTHVIIGILIFDTL